MAGHSEEVEALRRLYACAAAPGADETGGWGPFLHALAALTHADTATLIVGASPGDRRVWQGHPGPLPTPTALQRMRPDRVYAQGEFDDPPATAVRAVQATLAGGGAGWLVLARETGDFRAAEGALLGRFAPHLATAADIWLSLRTERRRAAATALIGALMTTGWLALDATLRILDADDTAHAVIDGADGLRLLPDARLEIADPAAARALRLAVERALAGDAPAPIALTHSVTLTLSRWPGEDARGGTLCALIRAAPQAGHLDIAHVAATLGLSRSEARLAARLCDGETLAEAATALGWTLETARSCSKQIFARTGARGQTDLVRRILGGGLWLGQRRV